MSGGADQKTSTLKAAWSLMPLRSPGEWPIAIQFSPSRSLTGPGYAYPAPPAIQRPTSGFVEPSSCRDCALNGQQQSSATTGGDGCHGCNRLRTLHTSGAQGDIEDLVQRLTDEIISRLA